MTQEEKKKYAEEFLYKEALTLRDFAEKILQRSGVRPISAFDANGIRCTLDAIRITTQTMNMCLAYCEPPENIP